MKIIEVKNIEGIELGKTYRIKESVTHQGIGGKEIQLERYLTPDEVDERAMNGNIACLNFCMRRNDFLPDFNMNLYYGHVDNLGYVVCEDELELENLDEDSTDI